MQRRTVLAAGTAAAATLTMRAAGFAQTPTAENDMPEATVESGYAPVNGLQMYYEIHGAGEPLVLLHGAFATIDLWGPVLEMLATGRRVIAVELQGHGHTADIDRPFSYEAFADDVAALMAHLGIAQADIVGYSMGANTALQLAIRHPELARKLVLISGNYRTDGYYPELLALIQSMTPEMFAGSPITDAYARHAPDPDGFSALVEKMKAFEAETFAWPDEDIQGIAAPALIVVGDADGMRPEHTVALFRLLGGGVPGDLTGLTPSQLAVIPGATHVSLVTERSHLWLPMVADFLAAPLA